MRYPQNPIAAFFYSLLIGIAIMCVVITIFILTMRYVVADEDRYIRGIPYNFERYPYIERELRQLRKDITDDKCNACILEEYYSTTPEQRWERMQRTWRKYYEEIPQ